MTADPFVLFDGAYVLGALDASDRAQFESHLQTCAACRARVDEVSPTVGLFALVRDEGGWDPDLGDTQVPDTLLPGLLRAASRERTRRRSFAASMGVVAAACVTALVVVLWPSSGPSQPPTRQLAAVVASPVHASAELISRSWGTQITLHCRYDKGVDVSRPYRLVVIDRANRWHDAGSWMLVPDRVISYTGGTAVAQRDIAKVQVTLPDGTAILQLTV